MIKWTFLWPYIELASVLAHVIGCRLHGVNFISNLTSSLLPTRWLQTEMKLTLSVTWVQSSCSCYTVFLVSSTPCNQKLMVTCSRLHLQFEIDGIFQILYVYDSFLTSLCIRLCQQLQCFCISIVLSMLSLTQSHQDKKSSFYASEQDCDCSA